MGLGGVETVCTVSQGNRPFLFVTKLLSTDIQLLLLQGYIGHE